MIYSQNCSFVFGSWTYPSHEMELEDKNGHGILDGLYIDNID